MKKYPYIKDIPITEVIPNTYNPNTMSDEEVSMLRDNIIRVGYIDPILVVPLDEGMYRIIDGEHRWNAQQMEGADKIWCVVVSPDVFDEKTQKLQTVRANKIRGAFDTTRFNNLVRDLMTNHEVEFDDMAYELGFTDENEFDRLVDETRRSLPAECRKEFDKKVKKAKTPDEILKLAEALLMHYNSEDTIGANFLVFQYEGTNTIVVNLDAEQFKLLEAKFREVQDHELTIDKFISSVLCNVDMEKYIVG